MLRTNPNSASRSLVWPIVLAIAVTVAATEAVAIDVHDTRLLTDPTVSGSRIAFVYANDIWTAALDGTDVRRLTSHPGTESSPRFSPDGRWIAFTGEYERNLDVYVIPAEGGVPKRLTWHPDADIVLGFTPDGKSILFRSQGEAFSRRMSRLYTIPVEGGIPTRHPIPTAWNATFSPDGRKLAYMPDREAFRQWKNYRGGSAARLLVFDEADSSAYEIPRPPERSNDFDPMWAGDRIYFLSDRAGEINLFSFDPATRQIAQLTRHDDFPVLNATAGAGRIIYEQAGVLHLFDIASGKSTRLKIGIAADLPERLPRWASGDKWVRNVAISPSGARAAVEFRGEIVTVPAEKGDARNITDSVAAHDRSPAWSPDGKSIAWFSDASGEVELFIAPQDGRGTPKRLKPAGAGFYFDPKWSPDSKKISYTDNSQSIYVIDVANGAAEKLSSNAFYTPDGLQTLHHSWSPDSKWIAYTRLADNSLNVVYVYSIDQKKSWAITDGMADAHDPVFDASGKYLFFGVSTDAGPAQDWFAQSTTDMQSRSSIYVAVLAKGIVSPIAKQSDEEKPAEETKALVQKAKNKDEKEAKGETPPPVRVTIDFDGLATRIQALPFDPSVYSSLQAGKEGQLFFLESATAKNRYDPEATRSLARFDLESQKKQTVLDKLDGYELSRDRKKVLVAANGGWSISDLGDKIDLSKGKLDMGSISVKVDPPAEWAQIFDEAWRINRDYFYDPRMHGTDWAAMKARYAAFLPDLPARTDLNRVMQWMCSELSIGHHNLGGGDSLVESNPIPGGLLGADYSVENGRYRFAKVYGGLNWNPELRSPLTEPGVDVRQGEYLIAVDSRDLRPPESIYARFEGTAGKIVEITVGATPDGAGSRTVKVVPIKSERSLRNRDWVEGNLRRVTEATNGRVAYVYVPDTADLGHEYFKRYFFAQINREAIIIDERHNGGGSVADYYIDILRRPYISHWATRYGKDIRTPNATIFGPKVMLIDQNAGSGGDLLPWMFRKFGMGKLIGRATWGGLVGILGYPVLMDGGEVTAPNIGIWTDEGFVVENVGVPPDIDVDQTPKEVIAGRDPQLEKAIEVVMKELEANPVKPAVRPPFPVKAKKP